MEYGFNEIWSLQPSLFVSSKGAKKDELSVNAVYLELPVMAAARFKVADNTNIVLSAGPYFACGIAGNSKVDLGKGRLEVDTFGDDGLLKRGDVGPVSYTHLDVYKRQSSKSLSASARITLSCCWNS